MSRINGFLLKPFQGRISNKTHFLGCFFLTVWLSVFTFTWVAALIVFNLGFAKEAFLDDDFSWNDIAYNSAGILTAIGFLLL